MPSILSRLKDRNFLNKKLLKIIILGKTDTGKTFLSFKLAKEFLKLKKRVGILCSDLGQSSVGPPGCVSFKVIFSEKELKSFYLPADFMEFVGSLSPSENLTSHLLATRLILDRALKKTDVIIINTTGYIKEKGVFLKVLKIRITNPDVIVAIQEKDELEKILNLFEGVIYIIRLKKSKRVKKRTKKMRAKFREELFKAYFKNSELVNFLINSNLKFFREKMIVGFLDKKLNTLGLGKIEEIRKGKLKILVPSSVNKEKIKFILPPTIIIN